MRGRTGSAFFLNRHDGDDFVMDALLERAVRAAFTRAAGRVPAYRTLLAEAGLVAADFASPADLARLPVLEKSNTFQRFALADLCVDGEVGRPGSVLTSSGHSGIFAFGLNEAADLPHMAEWIDGLLDLLFSVRQRATLLINCLPMGVRVPTTACTLAETSVRPDMVVGLVQAFGPHYEQIILVGEAAFIKHVLESGRAKGVDWQRHLVHLILGEEPLAENARRYFERLLGADPLPRGLVASSMGVAEIGLNLFFEVPPPSPLIDLRRRLHAAPELCQVLFGQSWTPSLFTYDPRRLFVEFDPRGRLLLTTLDTRLRIPLIRYAPGDFGHFLGVSDELRRHPAIADMPWDVLDALPIVAIRGRGEHALAGRTPVYPEAVKEGIYYDHSLAELTTANFRLVAGPERVRVRIQLLPGIKPPPGAALRFAEAIAIYTGPVVEVVCELYELFGSGMSLDYERKFSYLKN